jgi:hypothetical protein
MRAGSFYDDQSIKGGKLHKVDTALLPRCSTVQVKQTITGLDRPLGFQEFEAPRIARQSAHEGGKVVSPPHRPPLSPRREAESTQDHSAAHRESNP